MPGCARLPSPPDTWTTATVAAAAAPAARRHAVFAVSFRSVGTGQKSFHLIDSARVVWIRARWSLRQLRDPTGKGSEFLKELEQRVEASEEDYCRGVLRERRPIRTKDQKLLWQGSSSEPPGLSCERFSLGCTIFCQSSLTSYFKLSLTSFFGNERTFFWQSTFSTPKEPFFPVESQ